MPVQVGIAYSDCLAQCREARRRVGVVRTLDG